MSTYRTRPSPKKGTTFVEVQTDGRWRMIGYVKYVPPSEIDWDVWDEESAEGGVWLWHLYHPDEHPAGPSVLEEDEQYSKADAITALQLAYESARPKSRSRARNDSYLERAEEFLSDHLRRHPEDAVYGKSVAEAVEEMTNEPASKASDEMVAYALFSGWGVDPNTGKKLSSKEVNRYMERVHSDKPLLR